MGVELPTAATMIVSVSPIAWILLNIFSATGIAIKDFWLSRKTCLWINFTFVVLLSIFLSLTTISSCTTFCIQLQLPLGG